MRDDKVDSNMPDHAARGSEACGFHDNLAIRAGIFGETPWNDHEGLHPCRDVAVSSGHGSDTRHEVSRICAISD